MGAIDAQLRKLLPSQFVCLVQHQAGKALSLETSSTITLRLDKVQNYKRFSLKTFLFSFNFGYKSIISVLAWVVPQYLIVYIEIISMC